MPTSALLRVCFRASVLLAGLVLAAPTPSFGLMDRSTEPFAERMEDLKGRGLFDPTPGEHTSDVQVNTFFGGVTQAEPVTVPLPLDRTQWFGGLTLLALSTLAGWGLSARRARTGEQARLRESHARYLNLYRDAPDIYLQGDFARRTVEDCNDTALRVTGLSREELIGRSIFDLCAPESQPAVAEAIAWMLRDGRFEGVEVSLLTADGSTVPVEASGTGTYGPDGSLVGTRVILRDITSRKEAERSLAMFRLIIDGSFEPAIWIREDDTIVYVNDATSRFLGVPRDDLLSMSPSDLVPLGAEALIPQWSALSERGSVRFEAEILGADGDAIPVELTTSLVDADGERFAAIFMRDLRKVRAREAERTALAERAVNAQRLEALGTLAGGVAHEFNNLLTGIIGYAELLQDGDSETGPDGHYRAQILKAGMRAQDLVNQILTFSRAGEEEREDWILSDLVDENIRFLRATSHERFSLDAHLEARAVVRGDRSQLDSIVINLIKNAADALGSGGGVISVATDDLVLAEPRETRAGTLAAGPYVRIVVQDEADGISEEALTHIFEPFFTTKPLGGGTGLGLSVVHGAVQSHGGGIDVESEVGVGTRFEVYPPVSDVSLAHDGESSDEDVDPDGRLRVLVVDDKQEIAEVTCLHLEALGYRTARAGCAEVAQERLSEPGSRFDLLVTDLSMPGMGGMQLVEELRDAGGEIPIVVMTGTADGDVVERLDAFGGTAVLRKPFRRAELEGALGEVLAGL